MRTGHVARRSVLLPVLATAALLLAFVGGSHAAIAKPRALTRGARHVLLTSAQITGGVNPKGIPTSYFFEWGATRAYGQTTPLLSVGSGTVQVNVGQQIGPLLPGTEYHFRIVATYGANQTIAGADVLFKTKAIPLRFEIPKLPAITVGTPFILSGTLRGQGAAHRAVSLQATAFPYLQPFTAIGLPGATDALGRFSFRVNNLSKSTEFRVVTLDSRPLYSPVATVHAALKVTLHVRHTRHVGVVRLYGAVSPAAPGAPVLFQVRKRAKPGTKLSEKAAEEEEIATVFSTQFNTTLKRTKAATSHFNVLVHVRHAGLYRAYVKPPRGAYVAGASATVRLRAEPAKHKKRRSSRKKG